MADAGCTTSSSPTTSSACEAGRLRRLHERVAVTVSVDDDALLPGPAGAAAWRRAGSVSSSTATRGSGGPVSRIPGRLIDLAVAVAPPTGFASRVSDVPGTEGARASSRPRSMGAQTGSRACGGVRGGRPRCGRAGASPDRDRVPGGHVCSTTERPSRLVRPSTTSRLTVRHRRQPPGLGRAILDAGSRRSRRTGAGRLSASCSRCRTPGVRLNRSTRRWSSPKETSSDRSARAGRAEPRVCRREPVRRAPGDPDGARDDLARRRPGPFAVAQPLLVSYLLEMARWNVIERRLERFLREPPRRAQCRRGDRRRDSPGRRRWRRTDRAARPRGISEHRYRDVVGLADGHDRRCGVTPTHVGKLVGALVMLEGRPSSRSSPR